MSKAKNIRGLTEREALFCRYWAGACNLKEAAKKAGFILFPERAAVRLLSREDINQEIGRLRPILKEKAKQSVCLGYERLAFYDVCDVMRILFDKDLKMDEIESMELIGISEIKKSKDGSIDIKFLNRFEALKNLEQLCEDENKKDIPFYKALSQSIKSLDWRE